MSSYRDNDFEKYSINVGIINFNEGFNLFEGYKLLPGLKEKIYNITYNLSFRRKLGEQLERVIENHREELIKDEFGSPKLKDGEEDILKFLNNRSYLPLIASGKVYSMYPYEITLVPSEEHFDFFFSLRLKQIGLQEIDEFLTYQLVNSFQNKEAKFLRFLKLNLREYSKVFYNQNLIDTVSEWMEESQKVEEQETSFKANNFKNPLEGLSNKIVCTADADTIEKYFHRLVKYEVLKEEEVDHILCYSFKVFDQDVEKKRFAPAKVKKGELMKFVHEFFAKYAYSRMDANQWIKRILMDCFTIFDRPDSKDKEVLEYIKDNWSKYPANYRFR